VNHAQYSVAFLRGAGLVMDLASYVAREGAFIAFNCIQNFVNVRSAFQGHFSYRIRPIKISLHTQLNYSILILIFSFSPFSCHNRAIGQLRRSKEEGKENCRGDVRQCGTLSLGFIESYRLWRFIVLLPFLHSFITFFSYPETKPVV
jgi:hypothetical protein